VVRDYFPGGWHHHDREGRPVFLLRLGQMDVKGIVRSIGEEGLTKLTLHICEEGLRLSEESSHRLNKPITTWSMLLDLGNCGLFCTLTLCCKPLYFSILTLPDPDPPNPHVFGPPGSGSISQRYGSGSRSASIYHQAKFVRKTLISTVL
jgi:hypothetical protein